MPKPNAFTIAKHNPPDFSILGRDTKAYHFQRRAAKE